MALKPNQTAMQKTHRVYPPLVVKPKEPTVGKASEPSTVKIYESLEVVAITSDENDSNYGKVLRWKSIGGSGHTKAFPAELFIGDGKEVAGFLAKNGLHITADKYKDLVKKISEAKPTALWRSVSKTGWCCDGSHFALPDGNVVSRQEAPGQVAERVILQRENLNAPQPVLRGTLEDWRENVAGLARGNSRLVLAMSAAFAAPLLKLTNIPSGGFHVYGESSTGKTTALAVASSVWGMPIQTWRTTDNALESIAEEHNDLLLSLDEIAQLPPEKADEVAYMLGNGEGKARVTAAALSQARKNWRLLFLSSGERTLAEHAELAGKRVQGGLEVRAVNIPADAGANFGIFEYLHGRSGARELADEIRESSGTYSGTAGPAFVAWLFDQADLAKMVNDAIQRFMVENTPPNASGEVPRVLNRFALLAAAGEMATEAGVTGWEKGEAERASVKCFHAWLGTRSLQGTDADKGVAHVREFLEKFGESRFEAAQDNKLAGADFGSTRPMNTRAGFHFENTEHGKVYLILPEVFKSDVCRGMDAKLVAKALKDAGYLVTGDGPGLQFQKRVGQLGKNGKKFYAVRNTIFGDEDGGEAPDSKDGPPAVPPVALVESVRETDVSMQIQ